MDTGATARVRFAPSPTGHLHIGGLRTALFNLLFARHHGATYLMRVEDTDTQRSTREFLASQLESLRWAGIMPDEPIVYQMSRVQEHLAAAASLVAQGYAYPCFCAPRDADDVVANLEQGVGSKYDGTCRNKKVTGADYSRPHAIRFKFPQDKEYVEFDDSIRGPIKVKAELLDDFIIVRRDKTPVYNFCVVVDDIFMRITHVIRGEDHIPNTIKQVELYKALGFDVPRFAHLPLILGKGGNKLSKRDAAVSVEEYRAQGFLPEALCNYLVRLGWSHGDQEIFSREELVSFFSLEQVGKKGAIFDSKKLEWLNGVYLRKKTAAELIDALQLLNPAYAQALTTTWDEEQLGLLLDCYKARASTLVGLYQGVMSVAKDPRNYDMQLVAQWKNEFSKKMLRDFVEALHEIHHLEHSQLLSAAQSIVDQYGEKLVHLAQLLRLAITGTIQSPGVFDLIVILGKAPVMKRIMALLASW